MSEEKKLYNTIKEDIHGGSFKNDITNDFGELKEFFLNDERKKQLAGMGKFKRFFYMSWWLLRELLLKLTPTRRLVLIIGIILLILPGKFGFSGGEVGITSNTSILGGILILFVLMLELKDKLLAKDELSAGRSVQRALMSERNPKVPGWKIWLYTNPANDVGGDLVDILNLSGGNHGVTLADVSGKGLGAALLMAKLQTIIRALTPEYDSLSVLFEKLNSAFHKDILPNSFASMIYVKLNEGSGNIELVNAGHLPPATIIKGELQILGKGDLALGLTRNSTFSSQTIELHEGDYLIAYSDGVTEARNLNGDFYGVKKLIQFLKISSFNSPDELGEKLLSEIKNFIGETKIHDDLSIVILKKEN